MVRISILILPVLRNNSSSCVIEVHRPHGVCVCISERDTRRTEWPTEYRHMQSPPESKTSTERERERDGSEKQRSQRWRQLERQAGQ